MESIPTINSTERPKQSESISKLAAALAKAQGQIENADKDGKGTYGKYATLAATWDVIRKPFADNEIAVYQRIKTINGKPTMCTMLIHSSGEYLDDCELEMKFDANGRMNAMQAMGSAVTYSRRYSLQAVAGVAPADDDDAEGSSPKQAAQKKDEKLPAKEQKVETQSVLSQAQIKRLFAIAKENHWTNEDVKQEMIKAFKVESTKDLKKESYEQLCEYMRLWPKMPEETQATKPLATESLPSPSQPEQKEKETTSEPSFSQTSKPESVASSTSSIEKPSLSKELKDTVIETGSETWSYLNGSTFKEVPKDDLVRLHKWIVKEVGKTPAPPKIGTLVTLKRNIEKFVGGLK